MNVFWTRGWEEGEDRFEGSGRVVWGWVDRKSVGFVEDELERELREGQEETEKKVSRRRVEDGVTSSLG